MIGGAKDGLCEPCVASSGDAAMFGNVTQSSPFDGILIDDRNERPLTVALVTIIMVWSFAFALTFASRLDWRQNSRG
jgi:hypothetical protein